MVTNERLLAEDEAAEAAAAGGEAAAAGGDKAAGAKKEAADAADALADQVKEAVKVTKPKGGMESYEAWLRQHVTTVSETEVNVQLGNLTLNQYVDGL